VVLLCIKFQRKPYESSNTEVLNGDQNGYSAKSLLLLVNNGLDISIHGKLLRLLLSIENESILLVFIDHHLHQSDISSLSVTVESNPEIDDKLTDQHTNSTGHQTANHTEQRWNDEESKRLVEHTAEAMPTVMLSPAVMMWATLSFVMGVRMMLGASATWEWTSRAVGALARAATGPATLQPSVGRFGMR
jgi:hypothetical protein